jgi:hypothetical protein
VKTLLVVTLVACGGPPRPAPVDRPVVAADAAPAPGPAPSPSGAECDLLLDHALAVATPADKKLSDDELVRARAKLHEAFTAQCLAMPRTTYTCAMAAPSMQDLAACDQATPSSSTSNSSVAPPGIMPPAPRAP